MSKYKMDWKEWLFQLIIKFRESYNSLSEEAKARVPFSIWFIEPCQVEIIEFLEPSFQILVVTHLSTIKDLEINIHTYPRLNKYEYTKLESILKDEKWNIEIRTWTGGKKLLSEILEDFLVRAFRRIGDMILTAWEKPFTYTEEIAQGIGGWLIYGDIRDKDIERIVKDVCKEGKYKYRVPHEVAKGIKAKGKDKELGFPWWCSHRDFVEIETYEEYEELEKFRVNSFQKTKVAEIEFGLKGYGTYFFPPIWVDQKPKATFSQRIYSGVDLIWFDKAFDIDYKGNKVVVSKDGFIAITAEDKLRAIDMLNEIMATAILLDMPLFAIRENEVGEVRIHPSDLTITWYSQELASIRTIIPTGAIMGDLLLREIPVISKDMLIKIIKQAEKWALKDTKPLLGLLLEAYTHFANAEYTQSFIMSWTIVEWWLSKLWDDFLNEHKVSGKRREKLRSTIFWKTTDRIIEVLNLSGKIDWDEYRKLERLKDVRNEIIHKGKGATREESEECLEKSLLIIKSMLQHS
jgi:hypothetical protein